MQKVTILGCGVVGAAIAYELSRQSDLRITVIDKQAPAQGSTGAALGVLIGVGSQRGWQLRQTSLQRYETLVPELEAITGLTIPYNRQGIVFLATSPAEMEKWAVLAKVRKTQGWELALWPPETLGQRCPQINLGRNLPGNLGNTNFADKTRGLSPLPLKDEIERDEPLPLKDEIGKNQTLPLKDEIEKDEIEKDEIEKDHIWGAVHSPSDRQIDPIALTTALVIAAQKNGVEFHFGVDIAPSGARDLSPLSLIQELETGDADWLILATGLGTTELTEAIGTSVDIRPVLGQAMQIEMPYVLGDPAFQPVISGDDIHIVPIANHNYWIGATLEFADVQGIVSAKTDLLETLRQRAINFCPALAEGKIVRTWSGLRPRPEGQPAPIIKKLSHFDGGDYGDRSYDYGNRSYERIILATGHYRNGVLLAPATAIAVLELLHT